jgi:hypothetical protein
MNEHEDQTTARNATEQRIRKLVMILYQTIGSDEILFLRNKEGYLKEIKLVLARSDNYPLFLGYHNPSENSAEEILVRFENEAKDMCEKLKSLFEENQNDASI